MYIIDFEWLSESVKTRPILLIQDLPDPGSKAYYYVGIYMRQKQIVVPFNHHQESDTSYFCVSFIT